MVGMWTIFSCHLGNFYGSVYVVFSSISPDNFQSLHFVSLPGVLLQNFHLARLRCYQLSELYDHNTYCNTVWTTKTKRRRELQTCTTCKLCVFLAWAHFSMLTLCEFGCNVSLRPLQPDFPPFVVYVSYVVRFGCLCWFRVAFSFADSTLFIFVPLFLVDGCF